MPVEVQNGRKRECKKLILAGTQYAKLESSLGI